MLRFVVLSLVLGCGAASGGYGGASSFSGGYSSGSNSGGYGNSGSGYGNGGQVIQAAIQSRHEIQYRDVPSTGHVNPTTIEVGANSVPLTILFRSASSNLNIQQAHDGAQGSLQETQSEDEPHRLVHSVKKPIIQEVREVITPYRKITQEIQPVQEEILTIVSRANEQSKDYGSGSSGGYGGSMDKTGLGSLGAQMSSYGGGSGQSSRKGY